MTPEEIEKAKEVSLRIRNGDVIDGAHTIDSLIAEVSRLQLEAASLESRTVERCAVHAWNHYMDTCLKARLAPGSQGKWNAAQFIRSIKTRESDSVEHFLAACHSIDSTISSGALLDEPAILSKLKWQVERWSGAVKHTEIVVAKDLALQRARPLPSIDEIERSLLDCLKGMAQGSASPGDGWIPKWHKEAKVCDERGDNSLHQTLYEYRRPHENGQIVMYRICVNAMEDDLVLLEATTGGNMAGKEKFLCIGRFEKDKNQYLEFNIRQAAEVLHATLEHVFEVDESSSNEIPRG
jgi:hypothetical protein